MNNTSLLHHFVLSAASRFIRLQLVEYKFVFELAHRLAWRRVESFLSLNPAGSLPVFQYNDKIVLSGARAISEWIEESRADARLLLGSSVHRAEIRRLIDWFEDKFYYEVGLPLLHERVIQRL